MTFTSSRPTRAAASMVAAHALASKAAGTVTCVRTDCAQDDLGAEPLGRERTRARAKQRHARLLHQLVRILPTKLGGGVGVPGLPHQTLGRSDGVLGIDGTTSLGW